MSEGWADPELLRTVFEGTEVLRKPISGIITGHHVLPYVLVGPHWDNPGRSVEVRGRIRVSPRLVLPVRADGPTYGDVFSERELMHNALIARGLQLQVRAEGPRRERGPPDPAPGPAHRKRSSSWFSTSCSVRRSSTRASSAPRTSATTRCPSTGSSGRILDQEFRE